jgi:hypothetical protein
MSLHPIPLNFLIYEENFLFLSVRAAITDLHIYISTLLGPKKFRFPEPTPSNESCPPQNHYVPRHINNGWYALCLPTSNHTTQNVKLREPQDFVAISVRALRRGRQTQQFDGFFHHKLYFSANKKRILHLLSFKRIGNWRALSIRHFRNLKYFYNSRSKLIKMKTLQRFNYLDTKTLYALYSVYT